MESSTCTNCCDCCHHTGDKEPFNNYDEEGADMVIVFGDLRVPAHQWVVRKQSVKMAQMVKASQAVPPEVIIEHKLASEQSVGYLVRSFYGVWDSRWAKDPKEATAMLAIADAYDCPRIRRMIGGGGLWDSMQSGYSPREHTLRSFLEVFPTAVHIRDRCPAVYQKCMAWATKGENAADLLRRAFDEKRVDVDSIGHLVRLSAGLAITANATSPSGGESRESWHATCKSGDVHVNYDYYKDSEVTRLLVKSDVDGFDVGGMDCSGWMGEAFSIGRRHHSRMRLRPMVVDRDITTPQFRLKVINCELKPTDEMDVKLRLEVTVRLVSLLYKGGDVCHMFDQEVRLDKQTLAGGKVYEIKFDDGYFVKGIEGSELARLFVSGDWRVVFAINVRLLEQPELVPRDGR